MKPVGERREVEVPLDPQPRRATRRDPSGRARLRDDRAGRLASPPLPLEARAESRDLDLRDRGHVASNPHVHLVEHLDQLLRVDAELFSYFVYAVVPQRPSS